MPVKQFKPTSPGRRGSSGYTFEEITTDDAGEVADQFRSEERPAATTAAASRSATAAAAPAPSCASIDFKRDKTGVPGRVASIEYDPNRTARIALIFYVDGEKRYILAPAGLEVGDDGAVAGPTAEIRVGNALPLRNMPTGTVVHNVELLVGRGGQIVRSAGASAQLMAKEEKYCLLRLPSGEMRRVPADCMATVGQVSNVGARAGQARQGGPHPLDGPPAARCAARR